MGRIDPASEKCKMSSLTPTDSEASKMLEAALQQMDGIISGASNRNTSPDGQTTSISQSNVLAAAQTLAMILQQSDNMAPSPDPLTAGIINTWLETHLPITKKNEISLEKTIKQLESMLPADVRQLAVDTVIACKDVQKQYKDVCDKTFYSTKCAYELQPDRFMFP